MASSQHRRVLHQPLLTPQPSPLKPDPTPPFFPTDSPPPLPPPINLPDSSSPVNITSLQHPSSPSSSSSSSSHTHLLLLAATASAVILLAASFFYYFRRRSLHRISTNNDNDKPFRPSSVPHPPSAAIYYMNPDVIASRKVDSPELRPLPQLPRRSFTHADDDDVFYSPKSTGSSSKHTSAAVATAAVSAAVERSMSGSCSSFSSSSIHHSSVRISAHTSPQEKRQPAPLSSPLSPSSSSEEEEGIEKKNVPPAPPLKLFRPARAAIDGGGEIGVRRSSEVETCNKPKLKALHWDKVKATSNREMVWDQLKSSSFKVNEEMMESLFVANSSGSKSEDFARRSVIPCGNQEMRVLDPKKAQNVSILIRALNVTVEEVREALLEGNEVGLGRELLECLLKMAPTKEEERKLKECNGDMSSRLGPAERFLKMIVDIPFAFRRVEALVYVVNFEHEVEYLMMSFKSLEKACEDLKNNRTFLKLLEAVLKTGNRMNVGTDRGEAKAFKLDTLLKLVDVKGVDGRTTLLHFVVKEMIKSEGGDDNTGLKLVSSLTSELETVKKAAAMDSEVLSGEVRKLCFGIEKIEQMVEMVGMDEQAGGAFIEWIKVFVKMAKADIMKVEEEEKIAVGVVKEIAEYFHGNMCREEAAHPFRIFMVVRDFLSLLDRVCKEMGMMRHNPTLK